ncbi:MAG: class I SAM-dependent methyltransferase [Mycobacterium sp.]|nr:class I SAM-dependent methyltransferase [Mycobacterium sp.]
MARTDDDTWDLASSVGVTATLVAAARALASREDDPLIVDPFAEALVRAVGIETLTRALDGGAPLADQDAARLLIDVIAVRTKFFDDFFLEATQESGIRQAVILASGLDSRAYRLPWPTNTTVFEIDQATVIDFKSRILSDLGASPAAKRRSVGVDLREDWPAALRDHGFDNTSPTAWIAEGLLIYLPPDAQDRLFDNITALSAPGSQIATEYHPDGGTGIAERAASMSSQWRDQGLDLDLGDLFYGGERRPVIDYLEHLGWQVSARPRPEMFVAYGRPYPDDAANAALRKSLSVIAIRK